MSEPRRDGAVCLEWGVATRALPGQTESGDQHLVQPVPDGVLVAAVDGLGHGPEAAFAARTAIGLLARHADQPLAALVERCHRGLLATRGVVMSLAQFNTAAATLTWLGVGNVEGFLLRADPHAHPRQEAVLLRGGMVGYQLPALTALTVPVARGDTLIFATDGIGSGFTRSVGPREAPQQLAERVLAEHGKGTDDALVLVARYLGASR
jgi:negative regulator of sigma-B (phosphoserine phosphatase)